MQNWQFGSFFYKTTLYAFSNNCIFAIIVGFCFDNWFIFYIWGTMFIILHTNLAYMFTFKTAVLKIIENSRFRKPGIQEKLLIYAKLRVLTNIYNNVFGVMLIPALKSTFSIMIILSAFIHKCQASGKRRTFSINFWIN